MKIYLYLTLFLSSFVYTSISQEKHLLNLTKLTNGGDNAEAYFSPNGKQVSFQSNYKNWGVQCDQIFLMEIEKAKADSNYKPQKVSTGKGRTTCSYIMPNGKDILYASTHLINDSCPPIPEIKGKYLWPVYNSYDIFVADVKGKIKKQLTNTQGYDAEATISPQGDKIVFTSDRSGDLELWTMDIDGKNQKQITNGLGYDGGAFFSPDGKKLVFRSSRPSTEEEVKEYKELLSQGLVAPTKMEIYTCNVDGSDLKQITHLGKANWAPYFHPSGQKIIFSSNHHSQKGYDFQLYLINTDGSGLEQITFESMFNAFPMFSPDGKKLIFSSNRKNHGTRDTNLFIADWMD
ncbi:MAG: PD40 domain-containing protein [Sphingobacteriaceae bacterium]|nr:PD40 domain-containing protein [Sphingobacteriaceae bacterium]